MSLITAVAKPYSLVAGLIDKLQPLVNLAFRLLIANVFFTAGLTKIKSWDTTLMLFEYEYAVPVIPFDIAAYLATAGELVLPVLLVIGLAGRFSAIGLFVVNIVAMISYADISPAGVNDHYYWGAMLLVLMVYGPGKVSLDHWLSRKYA